MTTQTDTLKEQRISALYTWIHQRPGLEYGNYGDWKAYQSELRSIRKDLHHARQLLRSVELSGITGEELLKAFSAYSGRMTWNGKELEYCTGQYWPTEYRRVVCAIAAQALWHYKREHCMPKPVLMHNSETGETVERYQDLRAGDWLRQSFRREYGRGIQQRWFD